ncbi:MAG: GGDEF domain-containing protein [Ruminococcus sp.]|nr:GGDEF domain-containing protein [Ruminococcus sp.]
MSRQKAMIRTSSAAAAATASRVDLKKKNASKPRMGSKKQSSDMNFTRLARSLASDYSSVYYINIKDDSYVEYVPKDGEEALTIASKGDDFFADTVINAGILVYEEDRERFVSSLMKDRLLEALTESTFTMDYRLVPEGKPLYYNLKATMTDKDHIFVGVRNVDIQKRREVEENEKNETFRKIAEGLASRYEAIYYIDTVTEELIEYVAGSHDEKLKTNKLGESLLSLACENDKYEAFKDDLPLLQKEMQKERFLSEVTTDEVYSLTYRLICEEKPTYVNMRAVRPIGDDTHIIIGISNVDASKRREIETKEALGTAISMATRDSLTGVKNKMAYSQYEAEINQKIKDGDMLDFSVVICDLNELKVINDSFGHNVGDESIKGACAEICKKFKHSPVFRIGGDEFAVILVGEDHFNRRNIIRSLRAQMARHRSDGKPSLACGIADFERGRDLETADVFNRADMDMYSNKKKMKRRRV